MDGLREAGFDVEPLTGTTFHEAENLLRAIAADEDDPQPVIVTLQNPRIRMSGDHAVAVIGIETNAAGQEVVSYLDPLTGAIESDASGDFWLFWSAARQLAFVLRP